jgi:hypothetical protein
MGNAVSSVSGAGRLRTVIVGLGLSAAMLAVAAMMAVAPAGAAKATGKTVLDPNAKTGDALASAGLAIGVIGKAESVKGGIKFPITGTKVTQGGKSIAVYHSGGLVFSDSSGTFLKLKKYVVKLSPEKQVIRATIGGSTAKIRLAKLKGISSPPNGNGKVFAKKALISNKAGKAIAAVFGVPNFAGANLGSTKTVIK